jgi:hypothetical protein
MKNCHYCHCSELSGNAELFIEDPEKNHMYLTRKNTVRIISNAHILGGCCVVVEVSSL